jgi:predicted MFS family arabinose efflux permease
VIAGALTGIILSIGTDAALVATGVFPSLTEPDRFTTPLLLLATVYRNIYGVAGSYLTARLAPRNPMRHALVLGAMGLVASIAGAVTMWGYGPAWYPLALVVLAMPAAWAGGKLRVMQLARSLDGSQETTPGLSANLHNEEKGHESE